MEHALISLNLYDIDNEIIRTLERSIIPWGMLKRALKLSEKIKNIEDEAEIPDIIAGFICEVFGNRVTLQELDDCADQSDMMAVFNQIGMRAESMGNALGAATAPKKQKK